MHLSRVEVLTMIESDAFTWHVCCSSAISAIFSVQVSVALLTHNQSFNSWAPSKSQLRPKNPDVAALIDLLHIDLHGAWKLCRTSTTKNRTFHLLLSISAHLLT